jgi:murein DD-endopeptidase MepM/ murein hydrolase activator NlpD
LYRSKVVRSLAAVIVLIACGGFAAAEPWAAPRTQSFAPDWQAARATLPTIPLPERSADRLVAATEFASERFPAVAESPVPVLFPYALGDDAHDRAADDLNEVQVYLSGFQPTRFFQAGPTGYDATFLLRTQDVPGFSDIRFKDPVVVQISAFNLLYELPEPKGVTVWPSGDIAKDFPGIRREILEHTLRYSFERFGIPYVVAIQCFDSHQRRNRLSCKNADRVALRFLKALRTVGGNPSLPVATPPTPAARPAPQSEAFRYQPVGKLVPGSGMRAPAGNADPSVYARIRFPAAVAPAYVNTQAFRRRSGLVIAWAPASPAADEANPEARPAETRQYVWRDNFCERRDFAVGQCPSGRGHQGQDILGVTCEPGPRKRDCPANHDEVVAARDGMILRESWNDSFFLVTNAPGERLRFRYLHMHPRHLDERGVIGGRRVKEGDALGTIGNFNRRPAMTSTHLHFEMQVPTRDGWVRVNPYMTLVASYEHLIGARGNAVAEPLPAAEVAASENGPAASGDVPVKAALTVAAASIKVASVEPDKPAIEQSGKVRAKGKTRTKKAKSRTRFAKAQSRRQR